MRSPDSTGSVVAVRLSRGDCGADPHLFFFFFCGSIPSLHNSELHPHRSTFCSNCTTALLFGAASCPPPLPSYANRCRLCRGQKPPWDDLFVKHDGTHFKKNKKRILVFCFSPLIAKRGIMTFNWDYLKPFLWGRDTLAHNVPLTLWCKPRAFSRLCQQFDLKVILSYRSGLARGRRSSVGIDHLK